MNEFLIRTEDIDNSELLKIFVETQQDRELVEMLKNRTPVVLIGSRGVGKSFLMKVAAAELKRDFAEKHVLPVYLTFIKSTLVSVKQKGSFLNWMLAKICSKIVRELKNMGLIVNPSTSVDILSGGSSKNYESTKIESISLAYENSWRNEEKVSNEEVPTVEDFKMAIEDICEENNIQRIVLFIDEAAHNFIQEQQDQFFTLFRDLRCAKISCKAAVYPGVTAYGDSFQASQDATMISLNRPISDDHYVESMKNMVLQQISDSTYIKELSRKGEVFTVLTYAASGNPRFLLKTMASLSKLGTAEANQSIKDFYRVAILEDHSILARKYINLVDLINWGRKFLEDNLLPEMQRRNSEALQNDKPTTCWFWISDRAPAAVHRAISLLEYSGLVQMVNQGYKASQGEIGTRYMVNYGCLIALESNPISVAMNVIRRLDKRRIVEFGANSAAYTDIKDNLQAINQNDISDSLENLLGKNLDELGLSWNMKQKLHTLGLQTIKDVLNSTEEKLKEAYYVGNVRARYMKSVALNSVYEYLI